MTFQTFLMYLLTLTSISMALPMLATRFWARHLTGPFADDIRSVLRGAVWAAVITAAILLANLYGIDRDAHFSTTVVRWGRLPAIVQWHIAMAVVALILGPLVLVRRKGNAMHRLLGRVWVGAMYGLSLTGAAMWVKHPDNPLIAISIVTAVSLSFGLRAAIRKDIHAHVRFMIGSYFGLLVSLLFAMLPGRVVANWVMALFV